MIPIGHSQAICKCKWRHLVTILTKFQNLDQISESRPNFRISTKFQNQTKYLNLDQFQNLNQISESGPNFRISIKFQNLDQISKSRPNFRISTKFQDLDQISESKVEKKKLKTLPEAQRTQGIESKTYIMFLTELNF